MAEVFLSDLILKGEKFLNKHSDSDQMYWFQLFRSWIIDWQSFADGSHAQSFANRALYILKGQCLKEAKWILEAILIWYIIEM